MRARHRQVWLAVGAGLLVIAGGLAVKSINTPAGAHPDECAQRLAASLGHERLVTGTGRHVAVIGDSYSIGAGLADGDPAWTARLPGRIQVFGYGGSGFSRAAGGCPATSYAARAPAVLRTRPALIVVEGGLNDFDQPVADIRRGYRRLMAEVGSLPVLVVGPAPAPDRRGRAFRVDAVLRKETARTRTPYVSMIGRHFDYLKDGVHLTADGQAEFGSIVAAALRHEQQKARPPEGDRAPGVKR